MGPVMTDQCHIGPVIQRGLPSPAV